LPRSGEFIDDTCLEDFPSVSELVEHLMEVHEHDEEMARNTARDARRG
jgi:predicted house-cleaning noncanonical NTP pyrophosphatase (MazG superfamily)